MKIPNDRQDLEAVFVLVDASIAFLPDVPRTFLSARKAALEYLAHGMLMKQSEALWILYIMNRNLLLPYWVIICLCFVRKDYLFLILRIRPSLQSLLAKLYAGSLVCSCAVNAAAAKPLGVA